MENSPDSIEIDPPAGSDPVDYSTLTIRERLKSKVWEARSSAYEEILASTDRSLVFDSIAALPNAFLDEVTIRGQESALKCIIQWCRGLVSVPGAGDPPILSGVLVKYSVSSQQRVKELVTEVFRVLAERFGVIKASSYALRLLSSAAGGLSVSVKRADPQSRPVAKGTLFRQICGCLYVLSDLKILYGDVCQFDAAVNACKELVSSPSSDKQIRESSVSFLQLFGEAPAAAPSVVVDTQENDPPSNKGTTSSRKLGRRQNVLSNSLDSLHESRSTVASPETKLVNDGAKQLLTKEWFELVESAPRWQDRREAWAKLNVLLSADENMVLPDEAIQVMLRTVKNESNVPISVEVLACASRVSSRQTFACVVQRLRDKNGPVQKSVFACIIAIMKNAKLKLDSKMIESELKPLFLVAKKEVLSLVQQLLPVPGLESLILKSLVSPGLADSDIPVRDLAIQLSKIILADAAAREDSTVIDCLSSIRLALEDVSPARKKVIEEALGLDLNFKKSTRPQTASSSVLRRSFSPSLSARRPETAVPTTHQGLRSGGALRSQLKEHFPDKNDMVSLNVPRLVALLSNWTEPSGKHSELVAKWIVQLLEKRKESFAVWTACIEFVGKKYGSEKFVLAILPSVLIHMGSCERSVVPLLHTLVSKSVSPSLTLTEIVAAVSKTRVKKTVGDCLDLAVLVACQPKTRQELANLVLATSNETTKSLLVKELIERDSGLKNFFKKPDRDKLREFQTALNSENPEKVAEYCLAIQEDMHVSSGMIETLSVSLQSVLASSSSSIRQSVLALLHSVTRQGEVFGKLKRDVLKKFLRELLVAVNDKKLRSAEPEIWAELNLSVVHAIANSDRPVAYTVLLELSEDATLLGLVSKCIDKLNRSLPQFLNLNEGNLFALLSAIKLFIRHTLHAEKEADLIGNECVQNCLKGLCSVAGLVEVGEFVGMHVESSAERSTWKLLLKSSK